MNSRRLLSCSYVLLLTSVFALATGCGSVNSGSHPTPTPTPTPPGIPSPTPTPGSPSPTPTPVPSPSPAPTPGPSNAAITGRVVDPSGVPVVGTVVVDLERGGGDFFTFMQTTADAQGRFRFDNVPQLPAQSTGYAIMVAARAAHDPGTAPGTPGSFYAPALLVPGDGPFVPGDPIIPGTDVGTIQLRFTSQGDIEGSATSTDSTQKLPIPIHIQLAPMRIFTLDFVFDYPWIGPAPQFNTAPGASCPAGTACGSFQLSPIPTDRVEQAIFSKSGYTFAPSDNAANFILTLNAFSLLNGKPDCNPPSTQLFANTLTPDAATTVGPAVFTGCQ
ncbi:MAG TPA: hypothetical protein VN658_09105 [Candidatus Acidoferrales bacterium]|nr:hypothetical protein [Candidatus Acidoferrales bacterium]